MILPNRTPPVEYIQHLLDLHTEATQGVWDSTAGGCVVSDTEHPHDDDHKDAFSVASYGGIMICESTRRGNADYIAEAHNAVPKLIHVIGVLRSALDSQMSEKLVTKMIEDAINDAR